MRRKCLSLDKQTVITIYTTKLISLGGIPYTIYDSRIYYATLDALPSEQLWVLISLLTAKSKINLKNSHLIPSLHGK